MEQLDGPQNSEKRHQDLPLSSEAAARLLQAWLGKSVRCETVEPLSGGISSAVYRLRFGCAPASAVVKLHESGDDDPLPRERYRLDYLRANTQVACPQVYDQDSSRTTVPCSYLLMQALPGQNLASVRLGGDDRRTVEQELAEALLELHSHRAKRFGDLGSTGTTHTWAEAFVPLLHESRADMNDLLPAELCTRLDRVLPLAARALQHSGEPTLVHNDVWAGNIMVERPDDRWHLSGLIDPVGLRYAEVEAELAYLEAFGTVGEAFFAAYGAQRCGYEYRRLFYWLNTYMVHVWLGLGAGFTKRIADTCEQIEQMSA